MGLSGENWTFEKKERANIYDISEIVNMPMGITLWYLNFKYFLLFTILVNTLEYFTAGIQNKNSVIHITVFQWKF